MLQILAALVFGYLTDRFGRKKLFMVSLGVYTVATVLTAFSMNPAWYFAARFLTDAVVATMNREMALLPYSAR